VRSPSYSLYVGKVDEHAGRSDYRFDVHLRTLSTNEPHPKALLPILSTASFDSELDVMRMEISGNTLGLLYEDWSGDYSNNSLEIWNWVEFPHKSVRFLLLLNPVDSLKESNNLSVYGRKRHSNEEFLFYFS
jgi:hypothetical protein